MKWLAADCRVCQRSGGLCGFNYTTHHFRCLCPNRTHYVFCRNDGDEGPGTGNLVAKVSIDPARMTQTVSPPSYPPLTAVSLLSPVSSYSTFCVRKAHAWFFGVGISDFKG
ncbi:unnamed protein product [Malus baccata var. baccata]